MLWVENGTLRNLQSSRFWAEHQTRQPTGFSDGFEPDGDTVMVVNGKIAHIDVDTGTVTTEDGGKIGDSEDRIKSIYGDDLTIEPHKYIEGGHYMTVAGDSASAGKAIVFETDGKQVTAFRAGGLPEVKWVEGCS